MKYNFTIILILRLLVISFFIFLYSCKSSKKSASSDKKQKSEKTNKSKYSYKKITKKAKNYIGTPYKYGGENPKTGFDCSGYVLYVYKKFGINLPRTTSQQIKAGKQIPLKKAKKGDLIFFTGRDANSNEAGHVGIIVSAKDNIKFIHASSSRGVVISNFNINYYKKRFLKVKRLK